MGSCEPIRESVCAFTDLGAVTASSKGTALTSGAGTNGKGAYVEFSSSLARDADYLIINSDTFSGTGFSAIDIAVGANGSEQVILANLSIGGVVLTEGRSLFIPFSIPGTSRVTARVQSSAAADAGNNIDIVFGSGSAGFKPYRICDTYGWTSASTRGTAVDPGGTANTKGAYSQIVAATTRDHCGLAWMLDNQGDSTLSNASLLMDIAIGAGGSEQIIIPNIIMRMNTAGAVNPVSSGIIPIQIPAGTRLAVHAQSSVNTAAARGFGITLYGFS